jgi:hypothetical protein
MLQFQMAFIVAAATAMPSLLVSAEGDAKLESRRSADGLTEQLVMSVPGAQLILQSLSSEVGIVACSGPMVEVIEGQCVPRQDLMSKQMIAAYVDEVVSEKMSALTALEVRFPQTRSPCDSQPAHNVGPSPKTALLNSYCA